MAKRHSADDPKVGRSQAEQGRPAKKQRISADDGAAVENLQYNLVFHQDQIPEFHNELRNLKVLLKTIEPAASHASGTAAGNGKLQSILSRRYKDSSSNGYKYSYLANLLQAWSFASQTKDDKLFGHIASALALLLQTLCAGIEFREHGIELCGSLLQPIPLRLIATGLRAPSSKPRIISACIEILTEIVSFDVGALASRLYAKKDFTFEIRNLVRHLRVQSSQDRGDDGAAAPRHTTIRTKTARYLVANLRWQNKEVVSDILQQGVLVRALFNGLAVDPSELVRDVLDALMQFVLKNTSIPRRLKTSIWSESNVNNLVKLLRVSRSAPSRATEPDTQAIDFLTYVCTAPEAGALITDTAWFSADAKAQVDAHGKNEDYSAVKNVVLDRLAQQLKPHRTTTELQLLLAIFKAAPELVAPYFWQNRDFNLDPKLTVTWIGYAAFILMTIKLPIPDPAGASTLPPTNVVLQHVLPEVFDRQIIARCLNQNSKLIRYTATVILIAAFTKFGQVLHHVRQLQKVQQEQGQQEDQFEYEAITELITGFRQRCPLATDILGTLKRTADEDHLQREASLRLLCLYMELTPESAYETGFDITPEVAKAFKRIQSDTTANTGMPVLQLEHLVVLSERSSGMRWWTNLETLPHSPFITLLLWALRGRDSVGSSIMRLLNAAAKDSRFFHFGTKTYPISGLVASLEVFSNDDLEPLADFLEECLFRLSKKPVKYQDDLESLLARLQITSAGSDGIAISFIWIVLLEQWPYVEKRRKEHVQAFSLWLSRLLSFSAVVGEDPTVLEYLRERFISLAPSEQCKTVLRRKHTASFSLAEEVFVSEAALPAIKAMPTKSSEGQSAETADNANAILALPPTPQEDHRHTGLTLWMTKEIEDVLEEGHVEKLILLLGSTYPEIRRQAWTNLNQLRIKLEGSDHAASLQMRILLGEVHETVKNLIVTKPVPRLVIAFCCHAVKAVLDPLHTMYPKLNKFLNKGPSWRLHKLFQFWTDHVLVLVTEDTSYHAEIKWLLTILVEGVSSEEDMAQFHLLTVFEKVLAYYSSTLAIGAEKELVLKLLARASQSGCCTSLVTRLGLLSWLDAELAKHDKYSSALRTLTIRFQEGCQQSQIDNWAGRRLRSQDSRKSRAETPLSVPWATEDDIAMPESVA